MDRVLNRVCATYLICWTFFPFMQVGALYRILAILCAGLWVFLAFSNRSDFLGDNLFFILAASLAVGLMVLWRILLGLGIVTAILQTFQFIIIILIGLISIYYYKYDKSYAKTLFTIILASMLLFCITTTKGVLENPYAARIANSEWLEERFEGNEMIGLYGYVYMCVFILPMLLYLLKKKITFGKYTDILLRLTVIAIIVMVFCAGYMIAIFCTLGSCLILWAFSIKDPVGKFALFILFLFFLLGYKTIVDGLFTFLMERVEDNPVYYTKLRDFRMLFLSGEISGETVDGRFSNYAKSWNNIVKYPLFGCYFFGKPGGGGHSAILDLTGRFGIGTAVLYLYLMLVLPHTMAGKARKWNMLDYILLVISLIFGILDPFFQELSIAIYFMFPFVLSAIQEKEFGAQVKPTKEMGNQK